MPRLKKWGVMLKRSVVGLGEVLRVMNSMVMFAVVYLNLWMQENKRKRVCNRRDWYE